MSENIQNNQNFAPKKQNGLGIAGMVMGIVSMVLACIVIGGLVGLVGLIISIVGICEKDKEKGMATAGIILNALGIIFTIIFVAVSWSNSDTENTLSAVQTSETEVLEEYSRESSQDFAQIPTETPNESPTVDENQSSESAEITFDEIKNIAQELNYKDIMRNPENYSGQYFCVTVKIFTVETGSFFSGYDRAYKAYTNDEYDMWMGDMIYLLDNRDTNSADYLKILEDDIVTVYGRFDDLVETKNYLNNTTGEEMSLQILYAELVSE